MLLKPHVEFTHVKAGCDGRICTSLFLSLASFVTDLRSSVGGLQQAVDVQSDFFTEINYEAAWLHGSIKRHKEPRSTEQPNDALILHLSACAQPS
jgi:hypothetical protein